MSTPHIAANPGDFAPAVLMPGDPKRARRMAEAVLESPRLISDVRGIEAFTGQCRGRPLSVMASGMGSPSIAIYATELFRFFGVERIVRVGTAGGIAPDVEVGDVLIGTGAHTTSAMNDRRVPGVRFAATASFPMAVAAWQAAGGDPRVRAGQIFTVDDFYSAPPGRTEALAALGVLGVEMEAAALYGVAAAEHGNALAIVTVSDHLTSKRHADMTAAERETQFAKALDLAIAAALA
jgi:purine-nucleoside phosphorylase